MRKKAKAGKVRRTKKSCSLFSLINSHPVNSHPLFTIFFFLIAAAVFAVFIISLQK